ncbi:MAG: hypothetical protein FJ245_04200 [Nitrospira sp.]|nr:hypothetical protein [Nitrospira sp.]
MPSRLRLLYFILCVALILLAVAPEVPAQVVEAQVNTPYVVQYGFGSYEVGGLTTNTYRIPIPHTFDLGSGPDPLKLQFTGYLGYSHADLETSVVGPKLTASQDYIFALPQVELLIPLAKGWTLKPYVAMGAGLAFNGSFKFEGREQRLQDTYDLLYAAGIGSLYVAQLEDEFTVSIGNRVGWAEAIPLGAGVGQGLGALENGLEVRHPIGLSLNGRELDLGGSFTYYYFFPGAEFSIPGQRPMVVHNQFEFGTSLGFAKPTKLWIFENPYIGVSYRFGDGLEGFRANFGFPF